MVCFGARKTRYASWPHSRTRTLEPRCSPTAGSDTCDVMARHNRSDRAKRDSRVRIAQLLLVELRRTRSIERGTPSRVARSRGIRATRASPACSFIQSLLHKSGLMAVE
jgi:hypothetical protein